MPAPGNSKSAAIAGAPSNNSRSRSSTNDPLTNQSGTARTRLLDLGNDELALILSHCGRTAPIVGSLCKATRRAWNTVRSDLQLLAQTLAHLHPGSTNGFTSALQIALAHGLPYVATDPLATRVLLRAGADVHASGDIALLRAAAAGCCENVKLLLAHGANASACHGRALGSAAGAGHCKAVMLLLVYGGSATLGSRAALCAAARAGHLNVLQLLLPHATNQHADDAASAVSDALCGAAEAGQARVVSELLAAPGGHLQTGVAGRALQLAARAGQLKALQALLRQPCGLTAGEERTAARTAHTEGHVSVTELLMEHRPHLRAYMETEIAR